MRTAEPRVWSRYLCWLPGVELHTAAEDWPPGQAAGASTTATQPLAAAVKLLRVLRCLELWENKAVPDANMPIMLQRLASAAAAAWQQQGMGM
eukprot:gene4575-4829_t